MLHSSKLCPVTHTFPDTVLPPPHTGTPTESTAHPAVTAPRPYRGGIGGWIRPLMKTGTLRTQPWSMGSFCFWLSLHHSKGPRTSLSVATLQPRGCGQPQWLRALNAHGLLALSWGHTSLAPRKTAPLSLGPILHGLRGAPALKKAGGETASGL